MRLMGVFMLLLAGVAQAEVYRCPKADTTVFSDRPCDAAAEPYRAPQAPVIVPHQKAPDLARQYDERVAREKRENAQSDAEWNRQYKARKSTEARLEQARRQRKVVQGMKADEVRRLLGEPTETSRDEDHEHVRESWTYRLDDGKTQVYFKDGVVTRTTHKKSRK